MTQYRQRRSRAQRGVTAPFRNVVSAVEQILGEPREELEQSHSRIRIVRIGPGRSLGHDCLLEFGNEGLPTRAVDRSRDAGDALRACVDLFHIDTRRQVFRHRDLPSGVRSSRKHTRRARQEKRIADGLDLSVFMAQSMRESHRSPPSASALFPRWALFDSRVGYELNAGRNYPTSASVSIAEESP